jgi:hypothetical protein
MNLATYIHNYVTLKQAKFLTFINKYEQQFILTIIKF